MLFRSEIERKIHEFNTSPQPVTFNGVTTSVVPQKIALARDYAQFRQGEEISESKVWERTSTQIRDLDGDVVANTSPREAEASKNASVARDVGDVNKFEVDPDWLDISKIDLSLVSYPAEEQTLQDFKNEVSKMFIKS